MDYNPYKWPYNWGNWCDFTPINGGITPFCNWCFGPPCMNAKMAPKSHLLDGQRNFLRLECFSLQSRGTTQAFWLQTKSILRLDLGGETSNISKYFLECSPRKLRKISNLTSIFFRWVGSTTNQI